MSSINDLYGLAGAGAKLIALGLAGTAIIKEITEDKTYGSNLTEHAFMVAGAVGIAYIGRCITSHSSENRRKGSSLDSKL